MWGKWYEGLFIFRFIIKKGAFIYKHSFFVVYFSVCCKICVILKHLRENTLKLSEKYKKFSFWHENGADVKNTDTQGESAIITVTISEGDSSEDESLNFVQ